MTMNKLLWISLIVTAVLVDQGKGTIQISRYFPNGLPIEQVIEFRGDMTNATEKTVINIQRGPCQDSDGDDNMAFHMHLDPTFMILNHRSGGTFGEEINYPFSSSVPKYKVKIIVYEKHYIILQYHFTYWFKHRIPFRENSNYVCIYGPQLKDYDFRDWATNRH